MDSRIETTLRAERDARGLTQQEMAELGGISRQSYAAIESGRSVPSTEVALRLARGLGTPVESLFRLHDGQPDTVELECAGPLPGGRGPIRLVQVGGRRLAVPLRRGGGREFAPADGTAEANGEGRVRVELFPDRPPACDLVAVGCDPAFQIVAEALRRRAGVETVAISRGSRAALETLARGHAHVAGVHLLDPDTGEYNDAWVRRLVPFPCERIRFASWEQCLFVRPGAGGRIATLEDLARPDVRFLNREEGSGTRMLLDRRLAAGGIPARRIPGYENTAASGHLAVAEAVASGLADAGVGIRAAGSMHGLSTLPLEREWYDLVIPRHFLDLPSIQTLLDLLGERSVRHQVEALGGYEVDGMGEPLGVSEPCGSGGRGLS